MIRKRHFFLFLFVCIFNMLCGADIAQARNSSTQLLNTFEFSWQHYNFDYKEKLKLPKKSREIGLLDGIRLLFTFQGVKKNESDINFWPIYGRGLIELTYAPTTYDGSVENTSTNEISPKIDRTQNTFLALEGDLGYTFNLGNLGDKSFDLTPYSGLYWRSWNRDLGNGPGEYRELYTWFNLPLGLKFNYRTPKTLNMALDVSYRVMFSGHMQAYLSRLDSHYSDLLFTLGNKPGYKIEAPISIRPTSFFSTSRYKYLEPVSLVFTPWYEYSAINRSNVVNLLYKDQGVYYRTNLYFQEPSSTTNQYGFNLGVQYQFNTNFETF